MTLMGAANKPANNVTLYERRKLDGDCTRCGKPAVDGGQLCAPHQADYLKRLRRSLNKTRARRRKLGRCTRCERPATEGELCTVHRVKRLASTSLAANKTANKVSALGERFERIRAQTVVGEDGRTRYHGQLRRGRQSLSALDEKDLDTAIMELLKAKDGLRIARAPANAKLPRIQRKEADHAALSMAHLAIRLVLDALVRNGYPLDVDDLVPDDVEEMEE